MATKKRTCSAFDHRYRLLFFLFPLFLGGCLSWAAVVPMVAAADGFRVAIVLETLTGSVRKGRDPRVQKWGEANVALNGENTGYKKHAEFNSDTGPRPRCGRIIFCPVFVCQGTEGYDRVGGPKSILCHCESSQIRFFFWFSDWFSARADNITAPSREFPQKYSRHHQHTTTHPSPQPHVRRPHHGHVNDQRTTAVHGLFLRVGRR